MEMEIEFGGIEIEVKGVRGFVTLAAIGLVTAALMQELA